MKKIHYRNCSLQSNISVGPSRLSRRYGSMGAGGGVEAGGIAVNSHDISVSALYFSLDNIVTPEVAHEHPEWSYEQTRNEAVRRIEKRSVDNIKKGYLPELDGQAVMETEWEIVETETGKHMATKNGDRYVTHEELWNNFEKFATAQGGWTKELESEKLSQQSMERALIQGEAKATATWLSHESGNARLLQVWEKQDDGHIHATQYDVRHIAGRELTQHEAAQVIERLGTKYDDSLNNSKSYPHVLAQEVIRKEDIAEVAPQVLYQNERQEGKGETQSEIHERTRVERSMDLDSIPVLPIHTRHIEEPRSEISREFTKKNDGFMPIVSNVIDQSASTIKQAADFVIEKVKKRLDSHFSLKVQQRGALPHTSQQIPTREKALRNEAPQHTPIVIFERKKSKDNRNRKRIRRAINAASLVPVAGEFGFALPVLAILSAEIPHSEKRRMKKKTQIRRDEGMRGRGEVGKIGREEDRMRGRDGEVSRVRIKAIQKERKSIRRTKIAFSEKPRIQKKEFKPILRTRSIFILDEKGLQQREKRASNRKRRRRELRKRPHSARYSKEKRTYTSLRVESRKSKVGKREHAPGMLKIRHVEQLLRVLKDLSHKRNVDKKVASRTADHPSGERRTNQMVDMIPNRRLIGMRKERQMKEKKLIVSMAISWVLLLLSNEPYPSLSQYDNTKLALKGLTFLEKRSQTPWILLSIIWHLAMIAEGGGQMVYGSSLIVYRKTKKKKKKQKNIQIIPNTAVIFAYGS